MMSLSFHVYSCVACMSPTVAHLIDFSAFLFLLVLLFVAWLYILFGGGGVDQNTCESGPPREESVVLVTYRISLLR
jgi:hypothetical protein